MAGIYQNELAINDLEDQVLRLEEIVRVLVERFEKLEQRKPVHVPAPLYG